MKESERERERETRPSLAKNIAKNRENRGPEISISRRGECRGSTGAGRVLLRVHTVCDIFGAAVISTLLSRGKERVTAANCTRGVCARAQSLRNKNPEACAIKHIRAAVIAAEQIDKEEKQRIKASRAYLAAGSPRRVPRGRPLSGTNIISVD